MMGALQHGKGNDSKCMYRNAYNDNVLLLLKCKVELKQIYILLHLIGEF